MKYLVTVVQGVTVEADTPAEAEALALALIDGGATETVGIEVEPLARREHGE